MKDKLVVASFYVAVVVVIFGAVWWEYSLWDECRATNSFWYCARVLSE